MDEKKVLKDHFQFVRSDQEDVQSSSKWETRMSRRYYDKLYKEFALVDLAGYKEGRIGMRWRIESEVLAGKGQLSCASLSCGRTEGLHSYEVPFKYVENGVRKMELVKVRTCVECSKMMFYKKLNDESAKQHASQKETSKKRKAKTAIELSAEAEDEVIEVPKPTAERKVIDISEEISPEDIAT